MIAEEIPLIDSWKAHLSGEFEKDYMQQLDLFLVQQKQRGKVIFPAESLWFNALNSTPFKNVKVVIIGQDPYPTPGFAHGLCFSVSANVTPIPKSLKNIYKELQDDLNITNTSGCLQGWADQGVLLLNSVLTIEAGRTNSHTGKGWETFTDRIIELINDADHPVIFVLWGAYAQKKGRLITAIKHTIIRSPHPSPLSAYRGFFGSKPFSQINQTLKQSGQKEIVWKVNPSTGG